MTKSTDFSLSNLSNNISDTTILPVLTGIASFGLTLALSTATQKYVGISTGTKILPTICGVMTVCAASLASERTAILTHEWRTNPKVFQRNIKEKLLATSSSITQQQQGRRPSRQRRDDDGDISTSDSRSNSNNNQWIHVKKLPVHEIRVYVLCI
jgi:hypothetical protein